MPPQDAVNFGANKFAEWWIALQVELHGQSSIRRLDALHKYSQTKSLWRVALVCLLTPVPCIVLVTLQDVAPLASPSEGIYKNYVFWIRNWIGVFLMTFAALQQFRHCLPRLPISMTSLVIISIFATSVGVGWQFACSHFIGFPLPFGLVVGTVLWTPAVVAGCYTLWHGFLRRDRSLLDDLMRYLMVFIAQVSTTFTYPAYIFVFVSIGPKGQLAFVLMLPIIKIVMKNWIARYLKDVDDLKPEVVIFNIEVFNALYVACSLQSSTAWATTGFFMVMDVVLAWLSFQDINFLLNQFDDIAGKVRGSGIYSVIDISIHLLRDPEVRNHRRLRLASVQISSQSRRSSLLTPRKSNVPGPSMQTVAVSSSVQPLDSSISVEQAQCTKPHTRKGGLNAFGSLTLDERVSLVRITLKLLFLLEFILLIEFTEVIMPIIYTMYMVAMSRLPNRQYYPRLAASSSDEIDQTAMHVFTYSMLELLSLICIAVLLNRKLNCSSFHHIAFVLDTLATEVQAKLILWTFYVVQSMLFHFGTHGSCLAGVLCVEWRIHSSLCVGVDFSLRFQWLFDQNPAPSVPTP